MAPFGHALGFIIRRWAVLSRACPKPGPWTHKTTSGTPARASPAVTTP